MTGQPQQQPSLPKLSVPPTVFGAGPAVVAPPQVNAYLRTRVMSAKPEELRLLLIEGAIKFAQQGKAGIENKQFEQAFAGLSQSREIVVELMTSIRSEPNPELADKVRAVLAYIYNQLIEGGFEKDIKKLDTAISLLEFERETWIMLMSKLSEERGLGAASSIDAAADAASNAALPKVPVAESFTPVGTPGALKPTYESRPTLSLQG
jgi:flagellar protein FliS